MLRAALILSLVVIPASCGGGAPPSSVAPGDPTEAKRGVPVAPKPKTKHKKDSREPVEMTFSVADSVHFALLTPDGGIVIAPTLRQPMRFGATQLGVGIHLIKLRPDGEIGWSERLCANTEGSVRGAAIHGDGSIFIAGSFVGTFEIGSERRASKGDWDGFVLSTDALGAPRWLETMGGAARESITSLALSSEQGYVAIGGWAESTFAIGNKVHRSRGSAKDGFVVTYDSEGGFRWGTRLMGRGRKDVQALAFDLDELLVAGNFYDKLTLGPTTIKTAGKSDIFLARYDEDGALEWTRNWGGAGDEFATSVLATHDGSALLAAHSDDALDLGSGMLPTRGLQDVILIRLATDGGDAGALRIGGSGAEYPTGLSNQPLTLRGMHTGDTNLGFDDIASDATGMRSFHVELDEDLQVQRATRPKAELLGTTNSEALSLTRNAGRMRLRF